MRLNCTTPEAYSRIVDHLSGLETTGSRAGETKEELCVTVVSDDPRERYLFRDDSWNLAFQLQEHWAYWAGANPGHVQRYNSAMEDWMVDGELPGSAYGDRLRNTAGHDQLERSRETLEERPESRRALMQVHQAAVEDYTGGDVSCTAHLHPFVRDGELHMVASLRSQDMYWGYAYDAANNQFIQEMLAAQLGLDLGSYYHVMNSCHYYTEYEDDALAAEPEAVSAEPLEGDVAEGFEELSHGLEAARCGDAPAAKEMDLRQRGDFFADWLAVVAAYELARHHDEEHDTLADLVRCEEWHAWIAGYLDG
jgi:hypothetical protein